MNRKINIFTNQNKYSIEIEMNSIIKKINQIIKNNKYNIIFLIDKKVFKVFQKVQNYKKQKYFTISCSEKIKSFKLYSELSQKILNIGIDRKTIIVGIGGGTLGDLSGFIASTLLRGLDLILIPTTLLAQVDSSIGGKNGINTRAGKNLVGTFYQPKLVLIDPSFLSTLSKKELLSGYSEIVKHSLIYDKNFFNWLESNSKKLLNLNYELLTKAIYKSILIKKQFVVKDEKEILSNKYSRAILNFGHTFGHALETFYGYKKLTHGEAISIGMVIASSISFKLNYLSHGDFIKVKNHLFNNNLPIEDKNMFNKKVLEIINNDKKNSNGKINFVLLKNIGKAYLKKNIPLNYLKKIVTN